MKYCIGIDIGSTCAKTVVIDGENREILLRRLQPTGWSSVDTAEDIRRWLEGEGISLEESSVAPCRGGYHPPAQRLLFVNNEQVIPASTGRVPAFLSPAL